MLQEIIYRFPLPVKMLIAKIKNVLNRSKVEAIKQIDTCQSKDFVGLNDTKYKKNLKRFLSTFAFSGEETKNYIEHLYYDTLDLIYKGNFSIENPTIICVVKNEADKLVHFFEHYAKLGSFNYVFIDNGSDDESIEIIKKYGGTIYLCLHPFETYRKLAWINKVYTAIPNGSWTLLLDADELLVYHGYENTSMNDLILALDKNKVNAVGAIMIDMFPNQTTAKENYFENYVYFENNFHEEKSFYCNSVYGGIREREFKFQNGRIFLIKKHPLVKKDEKTMLIHCHYIYPYKKNFDSGIYLGLLHYKLFDSELKKYQKIAEEGSYGNGSIEYKTYIETFSKKTFEEIFSIGERTEKYDGTTSLKKIACLRDVQKLR